jgi:hypothetical protein
MVTISRTILASAVGVDLISSATTEKQADENLAVFTVGAMATASMKGLTKP